MHSPLVDLGEQLLIEGEEAAAVSTAVTGLARLRSPVQRRAVVVALPMPDVPPVTTTVLPAIQPGRVSACQRPPVNAGRARFVGTWR
jgi:hypothetical protein